MEGILNVKPEQLIQSAGEFNSEASTISNLTTEMTNMVVGLTSVWEGEASTAYITKFKGLEDDIQKMIRMIQEHSKDLEDMARNYMDTEQQIIQEANSLSSDVIV